MTISYDFYKHEHSYWLNSGEVRGLGKTKVEAFEAFILDFNYKLSQRFVK